MFASNENDTPAISATSGSSDVVSVSKENISSSLKKEIANKFTKDSKKQKINTAVLELVYKYNVYTEDYIEQLLQIGTLDPDSIFNTLKEIKSKNLKK